MDMEDLSDIECHSIPGAGACGKNINKLKSCLHCAGSILDICLEP